MFKLTTTLSVTLITGKVLETAVVSTLRSLAPLPAVDIVFLIGGVSPTGFFTIYLALVLTTSILGVLGVLISVTQDKAFTAQFTGINALENIG